MSTSFSANQYDNAFISKKLGNWECPDAYIEHPSPQNGFTQIIANDRGHLLPGVSKSRTNPWGDFIGTWDIPKKIPGNCAKVNTARTTYAQEKLQRESDDADKVLSGQLKNANRRVMREGCAVKINRQPSPQNINVNRPPSEPRRSGAEAPGSKMFPGSPLPYAVRSPTPYKQRTPTPPRVDILTSPIPGVPDIPEVLAQEASRASASPNPRNSVNGLSAL